MFPCTTTFLSLKCFASHFLDLAKCLHAENPTLPPAVLLAAKRQHLLSGEYSHCSFGYLIREGKIHSGRALWNRLSCRKCIPRSCAGGWEEAAGEASPPRADALCHFPSSFHKGRKMWTTPGTEAFGSSLSCSPGLCVCALEQGGSGQSSLGRRARK